ncbi:MAG: hypothetical protein ACLFVQ_04635 [Chitinispirillaceae bacterium]
MRQKLFLFALILTIGAEASFKLSLNSSYSLDMLPTRISDNGLSVEYTVTDKLALKFDSEYFIYSQPLHKGVKEHRASVVSPRLGLKLNSDGFFRSVEISAGADHAFDIRTLPSGSLEMVFGYGPDLTLSARTWHTGRIVKAAAVLNRISSAGFSAELKKKFGWTGEVSLSYSHEYLQPCDSLLDTSLFVSRPRGFNDSMKVIGPNDVQTFSAYGYRMLFNPVYVGYAFEWKNARDSRYMLTGENDTLMSSQQGPPGTPPRISVLRHLEYSNYPFSGTDVPLNRYTHNIILSAPFSLGKVKVTGKVLFPFYSSQQKIEYPQYLEGVDFTDNYLYRSEYVEKFTSPMTADLTVEYSLDTKSKVTFCYNYFSFPYEPWGYFSSLRYYLNTFGFKLDYEF